MRRIIVAAVVLAAKQEVEVDRIILGVEQMVEMIYMDEDSLAEIPGELSLSMEKLKSFHPSFFGIAKLLRRLLRSDSGDEKRLQILREHLYYGQIEPAVIISTYPTLIIAAYSSDIDCILLLRFSSSLVKKYSLLEGMRLLSLNTYGEGKHADVIHGLSSSHDWNSFWPVISDFISDETEKIELLKKKIPEEDWAKVSELGTNQLQEEYIKYRHGDPLFSCIPSVKLHLNGTKYLKDSAQKRKERRLQRKMDREAQK